jgi:integrase
MPTTYNVRIWKTEKYAGSRATTYRVRWRTDSRSWGKTFRTAAQAESFRSELLSSMRRGEAFDIDAGQSVSMLRREDRATSWYDFACSYVDMKWPRAAGKCRKSIAEALTSATIAILENGPDRPDALALRSALFNYAFNTNRRTSEAPVEVMHARGWARSNSPPVAAIAQPGAARAVLDALALRLDGLPAAATTVSRRRAVLSNALSYAVELGDLESNPIAAIKWRAPRVSHAVDRPAVVNPQQASALLEGVRVSRRSGPRLVGFFAVMYYSALRPEEAVELRASNIDLGDENGWGWLIIDRAAPDTGRSWTDSGHQRDGRHLKHRARGEVRRVPAPPQLTTILRDHLKNFGPGDDGRLFLGVRGGELATITYVRVWDRVRATVLMPAQYSSRLARRPYDLRHAAVSTWLNGGVAPTQVAEWAGHSVAVLLEVYAKCLDGQEQVALKRLGDALGPTVRTKSVAADDPD